MLNSILSDGITLTSFLICFAVSLVLGVGVTYVSMFRSKCTQSFALTLAILPAAVQMVIMLVNGNIGAGVAAAGAFGLVRFRSAPGTAKEIAAIFIAMTIGLACGMGYVALAAVFFVVIAAVMLALTSVRFGERDADARIVKITIPENLDYDGLFDDIFSEYTVSNSLERVKTTGMGTLYELSYRIVPKSGELPKKFFDDLRCRNGNLTITCSKEAVRDTL